VTSLLFLYLLLAFLVLEGDIFLNVVDKFYLNFTFYSLNCEIKNKDVYFILSMC
jgi:hypothetical protein